METPPPSWYPDPQRDGMLRWWDGTRWTENVQPALVPGKPVLGQEVTNGIGPITFYGPGEEITHAYPPITDSRYEGIELAELIAGQARAESNGGDVRVSASQQAAVEAVYQLRKKGGVLGALAGVGEHLLVDAFNETVAERARPQAAEADARGIVAYGASTPATWVPAGPAPTNDARPAAPWDAGLVAPRPPAESQWTEPLAPRSPAEGSWNQPFPARDHQAASAVIRAGVTIVGLWGVIVGLGAAVLVTLVGVVVALTLPPGDGPGWVGWMFPLVGAVGVVLTLRELVGRVRRSRM